MAVGGSLWRPLMLMSLAASSLAVSGFFAKLAMRSVDVYLAVTSRFILPCILTGLWLAWAGRWGELNRDGLRASVARALALCLAQFCLYSCMQEASLAAATILYNTGPLFITLYSSITRRHFSSWRCLALMLGFGGVLTMTQPGRLSAASWANLTGLLSGFFQAASQILLHRATKTMGTTLVMFYVYLVGSLAWMGYLLISWHPLRLLPTAEPWWWIFLVVSALGSMGNQQLRGEAYRRVEDPAVLSPLIYLSIAVSAALDHWVFHTQLKPEQWLGAGLIVAGALVSTRDKDKV